MANALTLDNPPLRRDKGSSVDPEQFRGPDGWTVETKESVGYVGAVNQ